MKSYQFPWNQTTKTSGSSPLIFLHVKSFTWLRNISIHRDNLWPFVSMHVRVSESTEWQNRSWFNRNTTCTDDAQFIASGRRVRNKPVSSFRVLSCFSYWGDRTENEETGSSFPEWKECTRIMRKRAYSNEMMRETSAKFHFWKFKDQRSIWFQCCCMSKKPPVGVGHRVSSPIKKEIKPMDPFNPQASVYKVSHY